MSFDWFIGVAVVGVFAFVIIVNVIDACDRRRLRLDASQGGPLRSHWGGGAGGQGAGPEGPLSSGTDETDSRQLQLVEDERVNTRL